jgi:hypothetical protein
MPNKEGFSVEGKFFVVVIYRNVEFFFKIITHPQIVVSYEEINRNTTESRISASLPKTRTNPFGTTVLYSNQKSNKSPNKKITSASFLFRLAKQRIFVLLENSTRVLEHQNVGRKQSIFLNLISSCCFYIVFTKIRKICRVKKHILSDICYISSIDVF